MGSVFGGRLAEAGVPTTLLDIDSELVERLNSDGLRLVENGSERKVRVRASADPAELEPPAALLFFVKCHQTARAAELALPLARDGAAVVSLQNGWGNADTLSETFGGERLVVGVTYTSATVLERGVVSSSGPGRTLLGPYADGEANGLADTVAAALEAAGFPVEQPRPVLAEIWKKLVLNAATLPTAALTGLAAGALVGSDEMRALVDAAAAEAVEVGRAKGFELDLGERLESIHSTLERAGSGKGSMLQDVEAGRRLEFEALVGAVLELGRLTETPMPSTEAIYACLSLLDRTLAEGGWRLRPEPVLAGALA